MELQHKDKSWSFTRSVAASISSDKNNEERSTELEHRLRTFKLAINMHVAVQ